MLFPLYLAWLLSCRAGRALGRDPAKEEIGTDLVVCDELYWSICASVSAIATAGKFAVEEAWKKRRFSVLCLNCKSIWEIRENWSVQRPVTSPRRWCGKVYTACAAMCPYSPCKGYSAACPRIPLRSCQKQMSVCVAPAVSLLSPYMYPSTGTVACPTDVYFCSCYFHCSYSQFLWTGAGRRLREASWRLRWGRFYPFGFLLLLVATDSYKLQVSWGSVISLPLCPQTAEQRPFPDC